MTLSNMIKRYLREAALQQAPTTLRNYTQRLASFLAYFEENHDTSKAPDKIAVLGWQRDLIDSGLANSTVSQYMTELKTFFTWCVSEGRLRKNPCDGVKPPKPDKAEKEFLTIDECKRLLSASEPPPGLERDGDYLRNWVMMTLALTTGVRLDSLIRLTVRDVDFINGQITLNKAKGGKSYIIPADNNVLAYVRRYIDIERPALPSDAPLFVRRLSYAEKKKKGKSANIYAAGNAVYASVNGSTFSSRVCTKYTRIICGHAVTAHELRHSTAMFLLENGAPPQFIQQQLGHSSLTITERYLHSLQHTTVKEAVQGIWSAARA